MSSSSSDTGRPQTFRRVSLTKHLQHLCPTAGAAFVHGPGGWGCPMSSRALNDPCETLSPRHYPLRSPQRMSVG